MAKKGRMPSVYDVAAAAGVSTASVSRFFRSPEIVSEATRARIEAAVAQLNYIPSGLARGLAERRTGMIGLYSFSGHEPDELQREVAEPLADVRVVARAHESVRLFPLYADEVLHGVELECTLRRLPLAVGWQDADGEGVQLDDVARRSDGLIVLPATIPDDQLRVLAARMPLVLLSRPVPHDLPAYSVSVDDEAGMRALTTHLVQAHGAGTFWYVGEIEGAELAARWHGCVSALASHGLDEPQRRVAVPGSRAQAQQAFGALLLAEQRLPDAIMCASDQTALGVLAALQAASIRVPNDVVVTGFDGISAGALAQPPLTTVRQPMVQIGREAVALLARALAGQDAASVALPLTLMLRRSCGCEAGR